MPGRRQLKKALSKSDSLSRRDVMEANIEEVVELADLPEFDARSGTCAPSARSSLSGSIADSAYGSRDLGNPKAVKLGDLPEMKPRVESWLENPQKRSKAWSGLWDKGSLYLLVIYLLMIPVSIVYIILRAMFTLSTAVNPRDASPDARYRVSVYPVLCLVIEILAMVSMFLYGVSKVHYSPRFKPARLEGHRFRIVFCICCYKEDNEEVKGTIMKAAEALMYAYAHGIVELEKCSIWLCDDTPPNLKEPSPGLGSGDPMTEKGKRTAVDIEAPEAVKVEAAEARLLVEWRRRALLDAQEAYPLISFHHRERNDAVRMELAETGGNNPKSCNMNSALHAIYPSKPFRGEAREWGADLTEDDIVVVLDADQECHEDFLTTTLPCFTAAHPHDNLAMVQTPQVFKGVGYDFDIFNHQNVEFWSTMMVSYNTTGFISCAGTNFLVKAKALRSIGKEPFPTHTLTEDFALGMRMRAANPPMSAVYIPTELVTGTAPDTIRKTFKQRSRWSKGPFKMLFSATESPVWYRRGAGPRQENPPMLSIRDRTAYIAPCFNVLVNAMVTPFGVFVCIFWQFSGHFPAAMTSATVGLAITLLMFTMFFKYFGRPSMGVEHVIWEPKPYRDGQTERYELVVARENGDPNGRIARRTHNWFAYVRSEWNADQNIRVFWWLFTKVVFNALLELVGLKKTGGWKATGGSDSSAPVHTVMRKSKRQRVREGMTKFEVMRDLLPLLVMLLTLWTAMIWGVLQYWTGVKLVGPLGISMLFSLYTSIPFWNQLLYSICGVTHSTDSPGYCKCYGSFGKTVFAWMYTASFFVSWASLIAAAVLALKTNQKSYSQNVVLAPDGTPEVFFRSPGNVTSIIYRHTPPWTWHS